MKVFIQQNAFENVVCQMAAICSPPYFVNSSPSTAAYMHQGTGSALVQIMACRLDGARPLSKPMPTYGQLDTKEHISIKFYLKFIYFHSRKCIWTCCLPKWQPFCPGGSELKGWQMTTCQNTGGKDTVSGAVRTHSLLLHVFLYIRQFLPRN